MKVDQFLAAVMGKCLHEWYEAIPKRASKSRILKCKKCGINTSIKYQWSPSLNGEISFEVRKWFQEHEYHLWEQYLSDTIWNCTGDLTKSFDAQLSIDNFYNYLVEHWQEWGYKDGMCKYPEVEKLKGEK
jgi:hypothetical protein